MWEAEATGAVRMGKGLWKSMFVGYDCCGKVEAGDEGDSGAATGAFTSSSRERVDWISIVVSRSKDRWMTVQLSSLSMTDGRPSDDSGVWFVEPSMRLSSEVSVLSSSAC